MADRTSHMRSRLSRRWLLERGVHWTLGLGGAMRFAMPVGFAGEAAKPSALIVRAWGGAWVEALETGISKPFREMTGIPVRYELTEDNEIQPKIWAAIEQGRPPPVHVNWTTTTNATESALRGVCERLAELPNLRGLLPVAEPVGFEGWPLVNVYSYAYVLAYREAAFPGGPPRSWKVLLEPRFRGRIALYDDGIGLAPVAQILGGGSMADIPDNMRPAYSFYAKLKAQQPLLGEDPDISTWFESGAADLACTILTNARLARQDGIPVSWTVPEEGAEVATDALWVPKGLQANEAYWAKQYVNYALSAAGQQAWCNGLGLPPVRPGLQPPADLAGDPAYPTTGEDFDRLLRIPTKVLVEHQDAWFAKFQAIMQS